MLQDTKFKFYLVCGLELVVHREVYSLLLKGTPTIHPFDVCSNTEVQGVQGMDYPNSLTRWYLDLSPENVQDSKLCFGPLLQELGNL